MLEKLLLRAGSNQSSAIVFPFLLTKKKDTLLNLRCDEIGELTLILDPNFKVIDENWSIDLESPFIVAKIQPDLKHSA